MVMKLWIDMSKELAKLYLDSDGNPIFNGKILQSSPQYESQILVSFKPAQPIEELKSLVTLLKDAVIEKFGSKPINAVSWLDQFKTEYKRLNVSEARYWEAICLFQNVLSRRLGKILSLTHSPKKVGPPPATRFNSGPIMVVRPDWYPAF